ncbi:VirB4 family type IV secretion system protein [Massilia sp. LC238]|jgi:type IV secretion system protein VirB4|uniref:VirB4 family type IV secretion system protein n=2 Tax=Pseudomonadota TaxID=1224 RepID=UPI0004E2B6A1|nr:VirB4 family type IV secretion system protein [Massilia sp. LC238]KFC72638.1 VirB4 [Massilia sp. LC238]
MLKIRFREEDGADVHPLQALCPWLNHVTPGLVLNKDGSLLAAFEYRGVDPDDLFDAQVDSYTEQMQKVFSRLDSRVTAWWIVDKRRDPSYVPGDFQNQTAADLDEIYSERFKSGMHFSTRYTLYLLYTGSTGSDKFFDRVARIQSEKGVAVAAALMGALKESLSGRKAFARDVGTLRDNIISFERTIAGFINAAPIKMKRLEADDFTSALGAVLNRASNATRMKKPESAMLDAYLPRNYVAAGPDLIKFEGSQRSTFVGVVGIKGWPPSTSPMLFETLAAMDMEMTICQIVRFLDAGESAATINPAIEYYHLTQYGLITHAIAKASGSEPEAKPGKESMLYACKEAQERIGAEGVTYAYMAMSVFVYGDTKGELKRSCDRVITNLENNGFTADRERINAMPAFAALLPGQWATQSRYDLVSVENVADACPIYTMDEGRREHAFFSKQVFRKPVPQLAVFGNRYGGRFNFSSHVDQVGHMLIIAPTGSGKSTFVNFCLSQFQRYGSDVRTIVFDRNRSCEVVTKLHGGQHIDLKKRSTRLNPLAMMRDGTDDGRTWVREFILRRFAEGGFIADTDDRQNLDMALQQLADGDGPVSMSKLAVLVSKRLEAQLAEWLQGRPYGMFDNEEDDLSLSNWTTIEMASILSVDRIARAFIDLVFRKIFTQLDGRPTFIYIEEASFLVNDPRFAPMIAEWLKAIRSRNGFLWMTIQSPESVTNAEMSATILDNIFSFLLLHNKKIESHRHHYRDNFGFEDHQIDMIAALQPKRDYLLIQDGHARVMTTEFTPAALAYLRSEKAVLNVFDKHEASNEPEWKRDYLNEVRSM